MLRWSIPLLLLLAACSRPRDVTVEATLPGTGASGGPAAGFMFVVLPYDRDSLIAAFEAGARTPRPATEALDSLFARYRAPFAAYTSLTAEAARYGDSLAALKEELAGMSRSDEAYGAAYGRWTALRDSLRTLDGEAARARATLEAARPGFVARSESLRSALRHWQDSTYFGYDRTVDSIVKAIHRTPVADTTDAAGRAEVQLRGGPWWIYARYWDPSDPNAEWYWNVPVTSDTVRLNATTGVNRPRY